MTARFCSVLAFSWFSQFCRRCLQGAPVISFAFGRGGIQCAELCWLCCYRSWPAWLGCSSFTLRLRRRRFQYFTEINGIFLVRPRSPRTGDYSQLLSMHVCWAPFLFFCFCSGLRAANPFYL